MVAILTFETTGHAIRGERLLLDAGESVQVMPLPGRIAAGCGICLRMPPQRLDAALAVLERGGARAQGSYLSVGGGYKPLPPPVFTRALGLRPGDAVAVIGCGGKTSLINRLAMENRFLPILLSTTTRIRRPSDAVVDRLWSGETVLPPSVTLACEDDGGKLRGIPGETLERLLPRDGLTLLEADGSRGLPLKWWAAYEPAVPPYATVTIGVCAISPQGKAFSNDECHRPELFRRATGIEEGDAVGVAHIAAMAKEMFRKAVGRTALFVNQVETAGGAHAARLLAGRMDGMPAAAGSVRDGTIAFISEDGNA